MVKSSSVSLLVLANAFVAASHVAADLPDGTWPSSTGTVRYSKPYRIKAGEVFDGKMQMFERSDITCTDGEGQRESAVFHVEAGGTLMNAIIGKNQKEGVHCINHDCTINNVWWNDVCEDAISIKGGSASSVTTVTNCGARYASDKVVQHNGPGTVNIKGFFAQEFGQMYRSCGTCGNIRRKVAMDDVYAIDPVWGIVTVNKNYGDEAKLNNIHIKTTSGTLRARVCRWSEGSRGPKRMGYGPSGKLCQYSMNDVYINEDRIPRSSPSVRSSNVTEKYSLVPSTGGSNATNDKRDSGVNTDNLPRSSKMPSSSVDFSLISKN